MVDTQTALPPTQVPALPPEPPPDPVLPEARPVFRVWSDIIALLILGYAIARLMLLTDIDTILTLGIPEYVMDHDQKLSPITYLSKRAEQETDNWGSELVFFPTDRIRTIPEFIGNFHTLNKIIIHNNPITSLPESIGTIPTLQYLTVQGTHLTTLPQSLAQNTKLEDLSLQANRISTLPDIFSSMQNLTVLNLPHNRLSSLPPSIANLSSLILLDLTGNNFTHVPTPLPPNLQALYIGDNPIPVEELHRVQDAYRESPVNFFY